MNSLDRENQDCSQIELLALRERIKTSVPGRVPKLRPQNPGELAEPHLLAEPSHPTMLRVAGLFLRVAAPHLIDGWDSRGFMVWLTPSHIL